MSSYRMVRNEDDLLVEEAQVVYGELRVMIIELLYHRYLLEIQNRLLH